MFSLKEMQPIFVELEETGDGSGWFGSCEGRGNR